MTKPKPRTKTPSLETQAAMAEAEAMILGRQLAPGSKEARENGCSCPIADNRGHARREKRKWGSHVRDQRRLLSTPPHRRRIEP